MVTMTFDQYDKIYDKMLDVEIDDTFKYPELSDVPRLLTTNSGFKTVMLAFLNTSDKTYRHELNKIMKQLIELTDDVEVAKEKKPKKRKKHFSEEQHKKIIETVRDMDFQLYGYFPSVEEIRTQVTDLTEENLAFLYWLINSPEQLTPEEEKVRSFLTAYIAQFNQ